MEEGRGEFCGELGEPRSGGLVGDLNVSLVRFK